MQCRNLIDAAKPLLHLQKNVEPCKQTSTSALLRCTHAHFACTAKRRHSTGSLGPRCCQQTVRQTRSPQSDRASMKLASIGAGLNTHIRNQTRLRHEVRLNNKTAVANAVVPSITMIRFSQNRGQRSRACVFGLVLHGAWADAADSFPAARGKRRQRVCDNFAARVRTL